MKLGYNPSFLILWMTCWGFGFKSCDVSEATSHAKSVQAQGRQAV